MSNSCRQSDGRCAVCGGDWSVCGCQRIFDRSTAAAPTPPVDAVPGEPAAWTRPGFPGAFISNAEKIHGGDGEWERDYTIPLYAASVASRAACQHRVADARNAHVQSGYVCLDCGAIFQAADHGAASRAGSEPVAGRAHAISIATAALSHAYARAQEAEDRVMYRSAGLLLDMLFAAPIAPAAAAEPSERIECPECGSRSFNEVSNGIRECLGCAADYIVTPDRERAASLVAPAVTYTEREMYEMQRDGTLPDVQAWLTYCKGEPNVQPELRRRFGWCQFHTPVWMPLVFQRTVIDRASAGEAQS